MAGVTVKVTGKQPRIDVNKMADVVSPLVVGHIIERNDAERDTSDRKFRPYSPGYRRLLASKGESLKVDHRVTGRLMSSVRETLRTRTGPDTMRVTWGVSSSMTVIAVRLQELRRWFGVSPKGRVSIERALARAKARTLSAR